jgi:murein DD-endopeptidase MepM/ murein hydrolase activator NlpD
VELLQPWPEPYTVNKRSPYGPRVHPITGKRTFHHGIDIAMPVGTPLTAGADGTVVHKGNNGSGGVTLILRHANNMHTVYYHLQKPSHLRIGDRVSQGQVCAHSGNTGASTGPHLHYELRNSRKWGDTRDPLPHIVKPQTVVPPVVEVAPPVVEVTPEPPTPFDQTVNPNTRPPWAVTPPPQHPFHNLQAKAQRMLRPRRKGM